MSLARLASLATQSLCILDPEDAHRMAIRALKAGVLPRAPQLAQSLSTSVFGRAFPHPIGLAAGFDKDAEVIAPLLRAGAGFVEIGAVTPEPQPGNPRPRVFRLPADKAVINRYGFNSGGHELVRQRLADFRRFSREADGIVGVNLGMNKESADPVGSYRDGVRVFAADADFLTINVSSPNTPGLRELQQEDLLFEIVQAARAEIAKSSHEPALLVKLSPDLADDSVESVVGRLTDADLIDGWIVSNTTIERPAALQSRHSSEAGGLSGPPLRNRTTELVRQVYTVSRGAPIIGVGGIESGADAFEKIRAGASLVQVYTSLIYNGPLHLTEIGRELSHILSEEGILHLRDAVGLDHQ